MPGPGRPPPVGGVSALPTCRCSDCPGWAAGSHGPRSTARPTAQPGKTPCPPRRLRVPQTPRHPDPSSPRPLITQTPHHPDSWPGSGKEDMGRATEASAAGTSRPLPGGTSLPQAPRRSPTRNFPAEARGSEPVWSPGCGPPRGMRCAVPRPTLAPIRFSTFSSTGRLVLMGTSGTEPADFPLLQVPTAAPARSPPPPRAGQLGGFWRFLHREGGRQGGAGWGMGAWPIPSLS